MKIQSAQFIKSAVAPQDYPVLDLPELAFAGKSNVGKSSLINSMTQRKGLAKTSQLPGCTQLINFFLINEKFSLVDLPGYGFAKAPLAVKKQWGPMVETYLQERQTLRLVLLLLDIRREGDAKDRELLDWMQSYQLPHRVVFTKVDKLSKQQAMLRSHTVLQSLGQPLEPVLLFSARTGQGRGELWAEIEKFIAN
jgi:GTP-binding protein